MRILTLLLDIFGYHFDLTSDRAFMNWEIVSRVIQIFSVLIPVIGWFVVHKLSISRENKASSKDTILIKRKYFKKFRNSDKYSWYERELFAKKIASNNDATISEVLFFLKFKNADKWMQNYFQHKKYIEVTECDNVIVSFKSKYTKSRYCKYNAGYGLLMCIAFAPLITKSGFDYYMNEIYRSFIDGSIIGGIWLIILPFISTISAFSCAIFAESLNGSKKFIDNFEANAIKIDTAFNP